MRTNGNLMITMALGGLWHGATWTFVVWGVVHGTLLVVHRMFHDFCRAWPRLQVALSSPMGTAFRIGATFLAVSMVWVLFRAESFGNAWSVYERLLIPNFGKSSPLSSHAVFLLWGIVVIAHVIGTSRHWRSGPSTSWPPVFQGMTYAVTGLLLLVLILGDAKPFIYFQF